jgi:hypothetical protein
MATIGWQKQMNAMSNGHGPQLIIYIEEVKRYRSKNF